MAKRAFKKRAKKLVVCFTLTSLFLGTAGTMFPVATVQAANKVEQKAGANDQKRNVMYYGDWSIWGGQGNFYPKDIPADQLTHLNFAFLDFDANGNLIFCDKDAAVGAPVGEAGVQWGGANAGILSAFQELRAKNPNLKIGISVGGWSKSGDFSEMSANASSRAKFVENMVKFVNYTGMDFVDLDWEYPAEKRDPDKVDNQNDEGTTKARPEDKENYIKLLQDLRTALDKKGNEIGKKYELTVALPAPKAKLDSGIDVDKLFDIVDFANIMTYDMRGAWDETSGHQTGLYPNPNDPLNEAGLSVDQSVNYLISQGAEADKIVIGAAYYTRGWEKVTEGSDSKLPGLFGDAAMTAKDADQTPSRGGANEAPLKVGEGGRRGGVWSYRSLDKLKAAYPGLKEYWDDTAKAPYLYDASTGAFFTYDNVKSINEKTKYVNDKNLGGMIAWMASQDKETTSTKRDELTKATKQGLYGSANLLDHEIVYSKLDVSCSVKPVASEWGGPGGGYEITIKNNEKLGESDAVLKEVERGGETIKTPKLYIKSDVPLTAGDHMAGIIGQENGYTTVDIKGVWEGKNIEPGQSYTFKLSTPEAPTDASAIKGIDVVQRMSESGTEIARQNIYGETGNGGSGEEEKNTAPTISGAINKTIKVGENFDIMAGITANDKEDGDLTNKIKVTGTVDTSKAGTYKLVYSVVDSKGLSTTVDRTITVIKDEDSKPEVNTAPVLKGVKDKTIKVGDKFNPLDGVTANDKEDGDLTSKIKVTGTVDTSKAGTYQLTYSVEDSKGLRAEATAKIIVESNGNTEKPGDTYDSTKVYLTGDTVVYNGKTYKAKWWIQGEAPDKSSAWEEVVKPNEDGSIDYTPGKAYVGGDVVKYNGKTYKANWWTNSVPGSDSSWNLVG